MNNVVIVFVYGLLLGNFFYVVPSQDQPHLTKNRQGKRLLAKRVSNEVQSGIQQHIVKNIPYPGRPIVKDPQDRMLEDFDALIYENNVPVMRQILEDPDKFTHVYGLSSMSAQQLCNMKRKNTGDMSLHIVAAKAYQDLTMAQLLIDYGANPKACNDHGWSPLVHPSNINFSRYLLTYYFNFFPILPDCNKAREYALLYKNKEKIRMLDAVNQLQETLGEIQNRLNKHKESLKCIECRFSLRLCSQELYDMLQAHAILQCKDDLEFIVQNYRASYDAFSLLLQQKLATHVANFLACKPENYPTHDVDHVSKKSEEKSDFMYIFNDLTYSSIDSCALHY